MILLDPGYETLLSPKELHTKSELPSSSPKTKSPGRKINVVQDPSLGGTSAEPGFLLMPLSCPPLKRHPAFVEATASEWNKCLQEQPESHFSAKWKQSMTYAQKTRPCTARGASRAPKLRVLAIAGRACTASRPFLFLPLPTPAGNSLGCGQQAGRGHSLTDDLNQPEIFHKASWTATRSNTGHSGRLASFCSGTGSTLIYLWEE